MCPQLLSRSGTVGGAILADEVRGHVECTVCVCVCVCVRVRAHVDI